MSSESDRQGELRVLCSQYKRVHFLLNRTQCSSSLFASEVEPIRSRHLYMKELIMTDEGGILFFDLHRFWSDVFRVSTDSGAELALVVRVNLFSESMQRWLENKFFPQISRITTCTDRMAFRIPSNTTMLALEAADLARHDTRLHPLLVRRGILAVHPTEGSLGYFCDLERLLRSRLLFLSHTRKGA